MCSRGNGSGPGKNAFCANRTMTLESLPIEYSITGRSNSATTSRRMWILSASRARKWERMRSDMEPSKLPFKDTKTIMLKSIGLLVIGTVAAWSQDGAISSQRIREHTRALSTDQMEGRGVGDRGG